MSVSTVIMWLIFACLIVGAVDYIIGGKIGLKDRFVEGFTAIGSLVICMAGIMVLVPVISSVIAPVISPLFHLIGADPSLFAGMFLPIDMGGYNMAMDLAENEQIGLLSGCVLSTTMGCTIVFSLPVGLGIIKKEDAHFLSLGMLCGFVTIPIGTAVAGAIMGIDAVTLLLNLIPVIVLAILLMLGIALIPHGMVVGFTVFGRIVMAISVIGLVIGAGSLLIGYDLPGDMVSLEEGLLIAGRIGVTLAGAFVLVEILSRVAHRPLAALGKALGIGGEATLGVLACLAHIIPMFQTMHTYTSRGKVVACAFSVSGSFMLASHLAFLAGVQPDMIVPMIVAKIVGGVTAFALALLITRNYHDAVKVDEQEDNVQAEPEDLEELQENNNNNVQVEINCY